jgi:hypothetical protein
VARRSPPPKPREMGAWGRWAGKRGGGMTLWTLGERRVAWEWRAGAGRVWPGNGGREEGGRSRGEGGGGRPPYRLKE